MSEDSLGDRMKDYESAFRLVLPSRVPVIIRVDGKAFHTLTRGCDKPFDNNLMAAMDYTALSLCNEIQGAQLAYIQSDEISILVHGYKAWKSEPWFGNEIQKMVSVSASIATAAFNQFWIKPGNVVRTAAGTAFAPAAGEAMFDSRVFIMPEDEVCNAFIWRQNDCSRNSVQMVARSKFSHKELTGKSNSDMHDMLHGAGINWNDLPTRFRLGRCAVRREFNKDGATRHEWLIDNEIPIFSRDREYVDKLLALE